jgi:hypothetical protein
VALLRTPLGCLTATILRLALIAAIGLAGYLLVAKPLLDKADNAIKTSGVGEIGKTIEGLDRQVQRQVRQALGATPRRSAEHQGLIRCFERASGNASRVRLCMHRL